ncbi:hypothetical protein [Flavobacterium aquicola]|uniref:Uncharacterized protein n=1 Tax=Flavobacterium aquicola TaxID=1682742 RepID=A0A3E0E799_9FLAO|nr:hypothetical protein [Flavobacterium aquicola]REG94117.1 hypothetical protein C8P67_11389 [Flavobacterium aquicola]
MENKDLGSKKINNKQEINEGFSGKNMFGDTDSDSPKLQEEIEIDAQGNEKIVQRARNSGDTLKNVTDEDENSNRGVTSDADLKKTLENRDKNSDITPNRYPNSHPDNHIDRGNQKLDE